MNKFVVSFGIFLFFLTSCSNEQAQKEIQVLQQEKQTLETEINTLKIQLDSIKAVSDSVKKNLSNLDME